LSFVVGGAFGLDAFLAHVAADGLFVDHRLLREPDAFDGLGPLLHDGAFLVQDHLVFGFGDVRAGQRLVPVRVGDRLAFDTDLFAPHRHGLLLLFGDDVLAQPDPARLVGLLADV